MSPPKKSRTLITKYKLMFILVTWLATQTRPMDNMQLSLDTPQEDELAVNVLSAGTSPYMPLIFMRQERGMVTKEHRPTCRSSSCARSVVW